MELFESIGLKADPFTTSPNPDLFFPAKEHKQCLEGLELAIRMRRGLSVVRGGIGTGKTTISRKLIQNFASEALQVAPKSNPRPKIDDFGTMASKCQYITITYSLLYFSYALVMPRPSTYRYFG